MTEAWRLEKRAEMEHLVEAPMDDLNLFTETGSEDKTLCYSLRQTMESISKKWADISRDFKAMIATTVDASAKKEVQETCEGYRYLYMDAQTKGVNTSADLYNQMETERLDREAQNPGGGGGGGTAAARPVNPRMDESLRPSYKASYALSLDEFKRWQGTASSWGLALGHEYIDPLVQKMFYEQIAEKEFFENCNQSGRCVTFQHYVEEAILVYNKRVSIFLRRSEFMEATRNENEAYLSYFNRLRKLADMANIKTMTKKELVMHMVMLSLPTNLVKQVTNMTINPKLDDVLGTLEVVKQQMRQLNNTNFPLPPDRSVKKKKVLSTNVTEEKDRGRERGG